MANKPNAVLLPEFRRDLQETISWTEKRFGQAAADRYSALIKRSLRDLREDPTRIGVRLRPDLAPGAYTYHLSFSRDRVSGDKVKLPRHLILYRFKESAVEFARLLHDGRDLTRHLPTHYES